MLEGAASLGGDLLGDLLAEGGSAPPLPKAVRISGTVLITNPPLLRMPAPAPAPLLPPLLAAGSAPSLRMISSWASTGE